MVILEAIAGGIIFAGAVGAVYAEVSFRRAGRRSRRMQEVNSQFVLPRDPNVPDTDALEHRDKDGRRDSFL